MFSYVPKELVTTKDPRVLSPFQVVRIRNYRGKSLLHFSTFLTIGNKFTSEITRLSRTNVHSSFGYLVGEGVS